MPVAWSIAFLAAVLGMAPSAFAEPRLERVVMLSRHGVRSPIRSIEALEALTRRRWPTWPVGPGEMTDHGARGLAIMADYLRNTYQEKGLLPPTGCPSNGFMEVWADAADRRTRQSGDIFAEHLAPGCGIHARHATDPAPDALFDATRSDACPVGLATRAKALASSFWRVGQPLMPEEKLALGKLQAILSPEACKSGGSSGVCLVPETGATMATEQKTLGVAAALAEGIYLEYVQGFPSQDVGWGRAGSEATITEIMPAYERGINAMRRDPLVAARRGALLIRTILSLLQGREPPADAPALSPEARLVMIAGHDSNLLQAAVLMGLGWRLPGQPSMTAPDTTLAFEVWVDQATERRTLRVIVYAQTLSQLREGTVLDTTHPPNVVSVVPEGCGAPGRHDCEAGTFVSLVGRRLGELCGG